MKIFLIVVCSLAGLAVLYLLICFLFAYLVEKLTFARRYDKNPLLKYYSAQDFNLNTIPVKTAVGKDEIRGYIYYGRPLEECVNLVIFSHGMGAGQCSYTTEIAYFCKNGCAVLAFDNVGCDLSGGKKAKGLEYGTKCLVQAARFAENDARLKDKAVILAGHSMGAYAALCATRFVKVRGVVAFSAPDSPPSVLSYQAKSALGKCSKILLLKPFIALLNRAYCGTYANIRASEAIEKSGAKALIIHGESDVVVPVGLSACGCAQGENVSKLLCERKGHNPYNTFNAEKELAALQGGLAGSKNMTEEERAAFFSSRNYAAICEEDTKVMSAAMDFINAL